MDLKTFELLAHYNIWATQRLKDVLADVSDQDFFTDSGLYFKSIFATLNHLLVGEHYLWFPRFATGTSARLTLNTIIEQDRHILTSTLLEKSHHWLGFLNDLDEQRLAQNLHYQTSSGQDMVLPYAATLLHVFNHGTHHRGQITAALTAMGYPCPELDLVYMLIEEKNNKD
ncbi:DinB family protein [Acinetobacter puyangensis]|uniref:Uncharacterized damage-inducible protein DinB (Forms a four-helix bundle) n=1 Tax=Acinetobacter puyangensis TaxID=1096779 RepID=A0A240E2T6_9GAMM|nr:DinB family protein [Acinetobacter puyangensis]SNX43088.1 Uncharacterized damage-inducible protein DinB (forms a four-helix bundle) [Acinetobacter puyangensis]